MKGQAIVEFALVMPVLLVMMLGFAELAMMFATRQGYQNAVDVMADWTAVAMAENPGEAWQARWGAMVDDEQDRVRCFASPAVELPDGDHDPGDRVLIRWACPYAPKVVPGWPAMMVVVTSEAVVPIPAPVATPSPS